MASGFGRCERTVGRGKLGAELAQYLWDKASDTKVEIYPAKAFRDGTKRYPEAASAMSGYTIHKQ